MKLTSRQLQSISNQLQVLGILACPAQCIKGPRNRPLADCWTSPCATSETPHPIAGCMYLHTNGLVSSRRLSVSVWKKAGPCAL